VDFPLSEADDPILLRVHDAEYLDRVRRACEGGCHHLDSMDTAICAESERVARIAAGSVAALASAVASGELDRGFAAIRPPGHHAERDLAMGFCLFNNVAVAARDLQARGLASRVLIADWDVHHGNGIQHIFEDDPSVFYFSLHQWPLYPGTGDRTETGREAGKGATLNCPLAEGSGDEAFLSALGDELVPAMESFLPDFVFISAGFDAHVRDPLGGLCVSTAAYVEATRLLCDLATRHAKGRLVSALEGGYDLEALAESSMAHLRVLLEHP
jgi:acetoin utilization deacetylase AcuC-like enzyme